jgi:regulator of sigma E protease
MTVLSFLLAIFILVGFHEFGHFIVARWCGVRVLKFSIGFGKPIWKSKPKTVNDTQWVIGPIPLGGFVKMLDGRDPEQKISQSDLPQAFDQQKLWKRSFIVAAGPLANFLLAWIFLSLLYLSGIQQVRPIIDPGTQSLASSLGIQSGDEVVGWRSLSGQAQSSFQQSDFDDMQSWNRLRWKLLKSVMLEEGFALELNAAQGGKYSVVFTEEKIGGLSLGSEMFKDLGVTPLTQGPVKTFEFNASLAQSLYIAAERVWDISVVSVASMGHLLTGKASLQQLSGPIAIADLAGKSAQVGLTAYIGFLALISISLGVLNLLPFPLLDGGQLMYDLWELMTGKRVSLEIQSILQRIGMAGLLILSLFTFFNDLTRLFLR